VPLSSVSCHAEAILGERKEAPEIYNLIFKSGTVMDNQLHITFPPLLKRRSLPYRERMYGVNRIVDGCDLSYHKSLVLCRRAPIENSSGRSKLR